MGAVIGATRGVVAFQGPRNGRRIGERTDNGLLGWIAGTTIKPFQAAYPGHSRAARIEATRRLFQIN